MTDTPIPFQDDLADAAARRDALDPSRSFIVQAPAGSGKTSLLVNRVLRLLATVDEPEEILAITFTRKAAEEMRSRIVAALREAAEREEPAEGAERVRWHAARLALARDRERGWNLARHPNRLRAQTIDSFCNRLAAQLPVLSGFGTPPAATEDANPLYHEAARATLALVEDARVGEQVAALVRHLDNNWQRAGELLAGLLAHREQWLAPLVTHRRAPEEARGMLEAALERAVTEALASARDAFPYGRLAEATALGAFAGANLRAQGKDSPLLALADLAGEQPGTDAGDRRAWQGIAELLLTGQGTWRKSVTKTQGFPTAKDAPPGEGETFEARKREMVALLAELPEAAPELAERLQAVRALPEPRYAEDQWALLDALIEVLPLAAAQLDVVFQSRGAIDFTGIALAARDALGEPEAPTDLALALDQRLSHLLVDEFQDTSNLQMDILERLTGGWAPGDGRTLFLVGDPMQSIYRFRDAEVGLFLHARSHGVGQIPLEPLQLQENFRSEPAVVEALNRAFPAIFPEAEDVGTGAVPYTPAVAGREGERTEAVHVHPVLYPREQRGASEAAEAGALEAEAARVAELVGEAVDDPATESVAVLARARPHLDRILTHLHASGIGYQAVEIEPLAHRPVIQDLLALTRALAHPADRTAWLAVLRAPWCGLALHDLHALFGGDGHERGPEVLADEARLAGLSGDGRARLERVRETLLTAARDRARGGLRRRVERTWRALGGPATAARGTDLDDARVLLDLVADQEAGGELPDPDALAERVAGLYARPEAGEGKVQVLSVHKAKGLEFDTVIVPGLGRELRRGQGGELLRRLERPSGAGTDLLLAPVHPTGSEKDPIYDYLGSIETQRDVHEIQRLLYVATTRAKRALHLVGHCPYKPDSGELKPPGTSLLDMLWPLVGEAYEAALERGDAEAGPLESAAESAASRITRLPADWAPPETPAAFRRTGAESGAPPSGSFEVDAAPGGSLRAGATARRVGTLVHRLLRVVAEEGPDQWDAERLEGRRDALAAELRALGVPEDEVQPGTERVVAAVTNALRDPTGRWILDPGHRDARCEHAVSGEVDGAVINGVIDRTFIDAEGTRWIIDYKTGEPDTDDPQAFLDEQQAKYGEQLAGYAALFRGLEERPVRLGLYFPDSGQWRGWSASE